MNKMIVHRNRLDPLVTGRLNHLRKAFKERFDQKNYAIVSFPEHERFFWEYSPVRVRGNPVKPMMVVAWSFIWDNKRDTDAHCKKCGEDFRDGEVVRLGEEFSHFICEGE